jgi:hypothetical protein
VEFLFVHISTKAAVIGLQMQPAVKAFLENFCKNSATFLTLVDLLVVAIVVVQRYESINNPLHSVDNGSVQYSICI